jgi:mono/diheme cytochrome c family protein
MPSCTPTNQLRAATLLLAAFASSAQAETGAAGLEFFENRIRPVFAEHCHECHSATAKKVRGDLKLDTREGFLKGGTDGAIVVPGEPEKSRLIHAVRYEDEDTRMPPKKDGRKKLPDVAIADLIAWVKMGAPYPETSAAVLAKNKAARPWAFDPVTNPPVPAVRNAAWPANSVDAFILAKLEERGLQPSPPADPRTLIRRATYDLTGLPPTPEEVEAFAESYGTHGTERTHRSNEPHPAYRALVDKLLASPRYGERWGRHWLDIVRYADTAGDTADYPVGLAWRYRNYVIDAFNADKPYDEFLREQIAGDVIAEQGPRERYAERLTATGFLAISRRFGFDSEKYQHLMIQDTIDTLGQTVLGLSLGCARCHDHKFDPISMRDYYALYGIFDSTRYPFPGSEQKNKSRSMVPLAPPSEAQPMWREYEQLVAARLAAKKQGAPPVVLRSLHDPDGDFEMQKDAVGGSYGVIVAPWMWEGKLSVTGPAQSPFKNLYPFGSFGVNIAGGESDYRLAQSLHPRRTAEKNRALHVNLDFRPAAPGAKGLHRFWLGAQAGAPAVELFISAEAVFVRAWEKMESVAALKPKTWHNLQLTLDLGNRTFGGTVSRTDDTATFSGKTFTAGWPGVIDYVALDSTAREGAALPGLELDNFGTQPEPIAPASTTPPVPSASAGVERDLNSLLEDGPCDMTYGVVEGTPHHARMQLRGEPDRPGDEVPRGFISSLGGGPLPPGTQGSGRLELAQWLTRPDNPLAARVMVNRIWQYHFGRGLVMTSNDFGTRGQAATHPELLDHLATKFVQGGWSVKGMHRAIMLSATYRQGSIVPEQNAAALAEHYSFFPRRRLSAEEMRDSILAISGELDLTPGRGHPFPSPLKSAFTQHTPFSAVYDHNQRSVYLMTQRIKRHPFLALFDGPDPNASTADRRNTTVPTQALYFLNAPFVHEKARKCAALLLAARTDEAQRIELAWLLTTGRPPTGAEQSEAAAFLAAYRAELTASGHKDVEVAALAAYVRTLFGSNEFLHLD